MFQPLSFEQNNPGITAGGKINDIIRMILANKQTSIQNQYMPEHLQGLNKELSLKNLLSQGELQPKIEAAQYLPQKALADILNTRADTGYKNTQSQWYGPEVQSKIDFQNAKIKEMNNPLSQLSAYPELFRAQTLYRKYADELGEDNPITIDAKKNYNLMQKNAEAMGNWRNAMTSTADYRFLPPVAKNLLAAEQAQAGNNPNASTMPVGQPIEPDSQQVQQEGQDSKPIANLSQLQRYKEQLNAQNSKPKQPYAPVMNPQQMSGLLTSAAIKGATTTKQYDRDTAGAQADNTINNLLESEPAMEYYTGAQGRSRLLRDKLKASSGEKVPMYKEYSEYLKNAELLSSQIRQFYGDSIQPEAMRKLESLANPSSWDKDPITARNSLNAFIKTFRQERGIGQNAMFKPMSVFQNKPETNLATGVKQGAGNMVKIVLPSGKTGSIPADKLEEAVKRGAKRV